MDIFCCFDFDTALDPTVSSSEVQLHLTVTPMCRSCCHIFVPSEVFVKSSKNVILKIPIFRDQKKNL
jgi:hypothetical protein